MSRELRPRKTKPSEGTIASTKPNTHQDSNVDPDLFSSSSEVEAPPVKKRKTRKTTPRNASSTTQRRGRVKGKLAKLWTTMPMETLCQIYGYLSPLDLLHMARTCKTFARFLLHPSSHSIWREARELVNGLPGCPEDLTEPKYAALCFSTTCNRCGKPHCHKVLWQLRKRWCESCRSAITRGEDEAYVRHWLPIVPCETVYGARRWSAVVCLKSDFDKHAAILNNSDDQAAQAHALAQLRERKDIIGQHAIACCQWEKKKVNDRNLTLLELRALRLADIKAKLMQAGWPHDQITYSTWERLPNVNVAKPLTKSGWETLKPILEQRIKQDIETAKSRVITWIQTDIASAFSAWVMKNAPTTIRPGLRYIIQVPEVETQIETFIDRYEAPYQEAASAFDPLSLEDHFERLTAEYQTRVTRHFSELLTRSLDKTECSEPSRSDTSASLTLAIALFRCERDETIGHHFPELWWHGHGQPSYDHQSTAMPYDEHILAWPDSVEFEKPWWTFDQTSSNVVREILLACGMSPDSTTLATLDAEDPRIVCIECEETQEANGLTMSWRAAIKHRAKDHQDSQVSKWRALTPDQKKQFIMACEAPKINKDIYTAAAYAGVWQCTLCQPGSILYSPQGILEYHHYKSLSLHKFPVGEERDPKYRIRSAVGPVVLPIEFSPKD